MDSSGRGEAETKNDCVTFVSILLCQWIPLEAVWTFPYRSTHFQVSILLCQWIPLEVIIFECFWQGGELVSILLCQWIPLEDLKWKWANTPKNQFQSFCVNGFLWKYCVFQNTNPTKMRFNPSVSMDSSGRFGFCALVNGFFFSFNPSVSMDSSGRNRGIEFLLLWLLVSILLCQWIPLEAVRDFSHVKTEDCFNPSVSMDSSGRLRTQSVFSAQLLFQSFCVNGFLWKPSVPANVRELDTGFNPSVSMDSSGSDIHYKVCDDGT